MTSGKDPGAFKTIGELSDELGVAQHILRYWETKFPQLRPLQRAGNRRYYRPADADLARRIQHLLTAEGYTIRGVQKLLSVRGAAPVEASTASALTQTVPPVQATADTARDGPIIGASPADFERLVGLRDKLVAALGE